jgi:hypothetical protein
LREHGAVGFPPAFDLDELRKGLAPVQVGRDRMLLSINAQSTAALPRRRDAEIANEAVGSIHVV